MIVDWPERVQGQSFAVFVDLLFTGVVVGRRVVSLVAFPSPGQVGQEAPNFL